MTAIIFQMPIDNDSGGCDCKEITIEDHSWSNPDSCVITGFGYDGYAVLNRKEAASLGEALLKWSKSSMPNDLSDGLPHLNRNE